MRSGYPDGPLALGVLGCERPEPFARLLELVCPPDGNPERPSLEQSRQPLQVLLARHSPDIVALRSFACRRERRGTAPVVLSFSGCFLCIAVVCGTRRLNRQSEEPPVGDEGGQDEQYHVHGYVAVLGAPQVRKRRSDHE